MLIGLKSFTANSIETSLTAMVRRALVAAPFHAILFFFIMFHAPELRTSNYAWFSWFAILGAALLRVYHFKASAKLLRRGDGWKRWRALFALHTWTMGLAWGMTSALTLHEFGISAVAMTVFAGVTCISAASVPAFSFDLFIQIIFQALILSPLLIASFGLTDANATVLSVSFLGLLVFMLYAGASVFRFQLELLRKNELVDQQKVALEKSHGELQSSHSTIAMMLESIDEAFLNFDLEGVGLGGSSQKTQSLIGLDPTGRTIAETLSDDPAQQAKIAAWFQLLASDRLGFAQVAQSGPKTLHRAGDARTIKLAYHALRKASGALHGVVVTGIDVTREMNAERRATEARERAELIIRIHENRMGFRSLLARLEQLTEHMATSRFGSVDDLKRELHTIKGGLMLFGAHTFAQTIHDGELALRDQTAADFTVTVRKEGLRLQHEFFAWRARQMNLFTQLGLFGGETVQVSLRKLEALRERLGRDAVANQACGLMIEGIRANDLGDVLEDFKFHIESTAAKLGKRVELTVARPAEPLLLTESLSEVLRTFVHLFNNAVDHGIEMPAERRAVGKNETGALRLWYDRFADGQKEWIRLLIEDDGGGIDIAKVRASLAQRQLEPNPETPDLEVALRIFDDGLSTRDAVSSISGQGVGMGAVKAAVQKVRGRIAILRTGSDGTLFEVLLPNLPSETAAGRRAS